MLYQRGSGPNHGQHPEVRLPVRVKTLVAMPRLGSAPMWLTCSNLKVVLPIQ